MTFSQGFLAVTRLAPSEVTRILATLSDGDRSAAAELLPLVYGELRALADRYLRNERVDHTLQATALVHEAYLRLVSGELRETLENTRAQMGAEVFRENLQRSATGIKGLAITRAPGSPSGQAVLDVEIVFADRNEGQRMLLSQEGAGWVITSMEAAIMVKPPIPYGTPVFK